jgi:hypothetical protein
MKAERKIPLGLDRTAGISFFAALALIVVVFGLFAFGITGFFIKAFFFASIILLVPLLITGIALSINNWNEPSEGGE